MIDPVKRSPTLKGKPLSNKPTIFTTYSRMAASENIRFAKDFCAKEVGSTYLSLDPEKTTNTELSFTYSPDRMYMVSTTAPRDYVMKSSKDSFPGAKGEFVLFDPSGNDKYKELLPSQNMENAPLSYREIFPNSPFSVKTRAAWLSDTGGKMNETREDFAMIYLGNNKFKIAALTNAFITLRITQTDFLVSANEEREIRNANSLLLKNMLCEYELRKRTLPKSTIFYAALNSKGSIKELIPFDRLDAFKTELKKNAGKSPDAVIIAKYLVQQMNGNTRPDKKSYEQIKLSEEPLQFTDGILDGPVRKIRDVLTTSASKCNAELANPAPRI